MQIHSPQVKVKLISFLFHLCKLHLNALLGAWSILKTPLQIQVVRPFHVNFFLFFIFLSFRYLRVSYTTPDPQYIDLSKNYIHLKLKIRRADGTNLRGFDTDAVGPISLIGKTFFKQCKLYLGSKLLYDSGDVYAYR